MREEKPHDRAPGDRQSDGRTEQRRAELSQYLIGLGLAVLLTATSFWAATTTLLWAPGVEVGLAVLAIAQMGVHLVFFLHVTSGPDNTNNLLAVAFGVLIVGLVVAGSLWIMAHLNAGMTACPPEKAGLQLSAYDPDPH